VIAADGGAELALALGVPVDVVVGDLDSIAPEALATLEGSGARIERHPREKDATDLALAFHAALAFGPRRILLVGAADGRVDHLLGELLLLGAEDYAGVEIDAVLGPAAIHVVRGERSIAGTPGELVSLFALHGPAVGVVTEGLAYPLHGETLTAGSSRGISNVFAAETARIALDQGVLLALRPGDES
jgi:thiamine pyrophosphokinase